jgi:hypothetical protein
VGKAFLIEFCQLAIFNFAMGGLYQLLSKALTGPLEFSSAEGISFDYITDTSDIGNAKICEKPSMYFKTSSSPLPTAVHTEHPNFPVSIWQ